jgi:hypothetical protein
MDMKIYFAGSIRGGQDDAEAHIITPKIYITPKTSR